MIEHTTQWVLDNSPDPIDPTEINWPERQARALIPFEVYKGRPICPDDWAVVHGKRGRNDMKFWGENPMAYALVTCTFRGVRYVLLIETDAGWAMPGGAIEPGEEPFQAAARELTEETHLRFSGIWITDPACWVPDLRGSMEAWAVTVVARCDLGEVDALPEIRAGDDARDAHWFRIEHFEVMRKLTFPAHRKILEMLR